MEVISNMRKNKLLRTVTTGMIAGVLLCGCANTTNNTPDATVSDTKEQKISETTNNEEGTWDKTVILNGEKYQIGDPVSTLSWAAESGLNSWPSDVPYLPVDLGEDGNTYIELNCGLTTFVTNIQEKACRPDECAISMLSLMGDSAKDAFPDFTDMNKADEFFGGKYRTEYEVENGEYDLKYEYADFYIYVHGTDEDGLDDFSMSYGTVEDSSVAPLHPSDLKEHNSFNEFEMGLSNFKFNSLDKVSNLTGEFIKNSDYATDISFDYNFNGKDYSIEMYEISSTGFHLSGLDLRGKNNRSITVAENTYEISDGDCEYDTMYCRYKGNVDIRINGPDLTEADLSALLEDFENFITVSDREDLQ